jgi:hypothetical protein
MRHLALGLFSVLLLLAGCDSMPEGMRQRVAPQPQVQVFEADSHVVFDAAQRAAKQMGFRVTRSGAGQGIINAISEIQPANALGEARQYSLEVRLQPLDSGRTEVALIVREQQESSSFAGATDIPLKQHGLYDSYFAAVRGALASRRTAPTPAK